MNDNSITNEELMLLACGELDEQRATEVRRMTEAKPALARELAMIEQTLAAVKAEYAGEVEAGFASRVRREIRGFSWRRIVLGPVGAIAAAILLVGFFWSAPSDHRSSGVAWADVVSAVSRLQQFHVTVFADEPYI